MQLIEALRVALTSLLSNQMRSILATLGIAIGIAAVSTLLSVGASFQRYVESQFEGLDTEGLTLLAQPDPAVLLSQTPVEQPRLTAGDIEAIKGLPNVREVGARLTSNGDLQAGPNVYSGIIIGADPVYLRPTTRMALGRFLTDKDVADRVRVVVLDWPTAQQLFPDGRPLGREVVTRGIGFTVIGVLAPQDAGFFSGGGLTIVPISVARDRLTPQAALGPVQVNEAMIYMEDPLRLAETQEVITELLRTRHKLTAEQGNDFRFDNLGLLADLGPNIVGGITAFLALIGSIALFVGGIGIMNIMLVSVTERTREIGLRRAVGARRRDILTQFLVEAITLSLIGGVAGVLLTSLLVNGGAVITHLLFSESGIALHLAIDVRAVVLALSFASAVGLLAGLYPALRASRLSPIDALRSN